MEIDREREKWGKETAGKKKNLRIIRENKRCKDY